jgi:hypothetical protein
LTRINPGTCANVCKRVVGATNPRGEEPYRRAMESNNLLATIYQRFGIDTTHRFHDRGKRIGTFWGHSALRNPKVESPYCAIWRLHLTPRKKTKFSPQRRHN